MPPRFPSRRRRIQPIAAEAVDGYVDYKDLETLRAFLAESGRIIPGRLSGLSSRQQRDLSLAIKRARYLALIPYTDRHGRF
jgi:small subunit ribosomal protein S18